MIKAYKFTNNTSGGVLAKNVTTSDVVLTVSLSSGSLVTGNYVYPITFVATDTDLFTAFTTKCEAASDGQYTLTFSKSDLQTADIDKYMVVGAQWELRLTAQEMNDIVNNLQGLDASQVTTGVFNMARIPAGAVPNLKVVANDAARFQLTTADVQNGDVVQVTDPDNLMYYVVDDTKLNSEAGYSLFMAGKAAEADSAPWTGITGKPSTFTPSAHTHPMSDITDPSYVPVGAIVAFSVDNVPVGWLECNGQTVTREAYPALVTHLAGSAANSAVVPDLRGMFVRGWDHGKGVDAGRVVGSEQEAGLPNIEGTFITQSVDWFAHKAVIDPTGAFIALTGSTGWSPDVQGTEIAGGKHSWAFNASNSNAIYGKSTTVQPANVALVYCINAYGSNTDASDSDLATLTSKVNTVAGGMKRIGEIFVYSGTDVPAGAFELNGQTLTNAEEAYPDFFEWVQNHAPKYSSVEELNAAYDSAGITGKYYISGSDIRLPLFSNNYIKAITVNTAANVGAVEPAGLPNITGQLGIGDGYYRVQDTSGAFYITDTLTAVNSSGSNVPGQRLLAYFNASRSSSLYGASTTVRPVNVAYRWFVQVYDATSPSSVADVTELVNQRTTPAQVIAAMPPASTGYISISLSGSPTSYTAPADGWIFFRRSSNGAGTIGIVNDATGIELLVQTSETNGLGQMMPVSSGDSIKFYYAGTDFGSGTICRFYYAKGNVTA